MKKLPSLITWTPKIAYVVGLLVTDGNLSKDKRHITLRSSDLDLLHTFNKCLSLKNKISSSLNSGYAIKPSFRIQFGNVKLYKWLVRIGITPTKSLTLGKINIPKKYFLDFLRGHLDGDGTILTYIDNYNTYKGRTYINQRLYIKFISASKMHILWLRNAIQETTGLKGSVTCNISKIINKHPIWVIKFSKKESVKLLSLLYYKPNLPSLKRKRLLAKQILEQLTNERRKEYVRINTVIN